MNIIMQGLCMRMCACMYCVSVYFAIDFVVLFLFNLLEVSIKFLCILVSSFLMYTFQSISKRYTTFI